MSTANVICGIKRTARSNTASLLNKLRAPSGEWIRRLRALTALVTVGVASLQPVQAEEQLATAPNGKPWLEGDTNVFKPYVNRSFERSIRFHDAFNWKIREFARTNQVNNYDINTNCTGTIPPERLKDLFVERLNYVRSRHGLSSLKLGINESYRFNEQDMADGAQYTLWLHRHLRLISHSPELYTNAPHYGCLSTNIAKACNASNLFAESVLPSEYQTLTQPFDHINTFLHDSGAASLGHRLSILEPSLVKTMPSWTPINYGRIKVSLRASPISFYAMHNAILLHVTSTNNFTYGDSERDVIYPPLGTGYESWSKSYVLADYSSSVISWVSKNYNFFLRRPNVSIVDETNGNLPLRGKFYYYGDPSFFAWQIDNPPDIHGNTPVVVRVTVSNLARVGALPTDPPTSVTWRYARVGFSTPEVKIERETADSVEVSFAAAYLYDGWNVNRWNPVYSPWALECSMTSDFSSGVNSRSLPDLKHRVDDEGRCHVEIPTNKAGTPKFFRLRRIPSLPFPGVSYADDPIQP